ncbi:hypothetical protein D3C84_689090 [compost metagenome]
MVVAAAVPGVVSVLTVYEDFLPSSRLSSIPVAKLFLKPAMYTSPNRSVWLVVVVVLLTRVLARRQTLPLLTLPLLSSGWVRM